MKNFTALLRLLFRKKRSIDSIIAPISKIVADLEKFHAVKCDERSAAQKRADEALEAAKKAEADAIVAKGLSEKYLALVG